jgi:hypothetical protein
MSRLLSFLSLSPIIVAMLFVEPAVADKRVALVVGNSTYRNVALLDNPANDARLLASTLRDLGFALVGGDAQLDLDKASFDRAVQDFGTQLQGADVGLFFYAGHGVQVRGTNYLIPVDANPTREADVDFQMLDTNLVMRQMEGAGTRLNLVILDACRNNPFGGRGLVVGRGRDTETVRLRSTTSGLAQMQAPEGTLISFATQPGSVARDGSDGHSPYSKALAETIRRPGLGIFDTFNQVGLEVKRATAGAQQPWVSSSPIDGTFYFVPAQGAGAQVAALPPRPPQTPASTAAPAATTSDVRRFDGLWLIHVTCEMSAAGGDAVDRQVFATIKDGIIHGEQGQPDVPGRLTYDGTVQPDGTLLVTAKGITTRNFRPPSTKFSFTMGGQLEGAQGTAIRDDRRNCNVKFAKQSAGAGSTVAALPAEPDVRRSPAVSPFTMPAAVNDVRRFDGTWVVNWVCESTSSGLPKLTGRFVGTANNGVFHGESGAKGMPGGTIYDGTIEPGGSTTINVDGLTGDGNFDPFHRPTGTKFGYKMIGVLEGLLGTATRADRDCNITFAKQSVGASSTPTGDTNPNLQRSAALGASAMSPAASDVKRFDGKWLSTFSCKPVADVPGAEWQFLADVKDGVFRGVHGIAGKPGSQVFDGKIRPDGEAEISVDGRTGPSAITPRHPPPGTKFSYAIVAKFEDSRGTGSRIGGRICDFVFAKR